MRSSILFEERKTEPVTIVKLAQNVTYQQKILFCYVSVCKGD